VPSSNSPPTDPPYSGIELRERNSNTIFPPAFADFTGVLGAMLEAEAEALADYFLGEPPLPEQLDVAARVALLTEHEIYRHELPASPDAYLVVGRHSEANVRADAPALSLRHVLLIPQPDVTAGSILLDVVALAPTMRIAPWPRPLPAALADACSALMLGDALLLVAPVTRGERRAEVTLAPDPASQLRAPMRGAARSQLPHAWSDHTRISSAAPALSLPDGDDTAADVAFTLEVRDEHLRVRIGLREAWLVGGIMLGRNEEKNSHASLSRVLTADGVSRCHLYLRREHDDIVFYDTASTNGLHTSNDETAEPIRRFVIRAATGGKQAPMTVNPDRTWLWLTSSVRVTLYATGDRRDE
jgi:hypothetical protein